MLHGRFDEGEARALEVLRTGIPGLTPLASVQLFYHRLELDRLGELEAATRSLAESLPGVTGWRFAIVRVLASMGRLDEAIEEIRRVGRIDDLPRDRNWLPAMALYAEVLPALRDDVAAAAHFERLRPYARVNVVLGNGSLFYGNNAYFLGLLATSLERWDEAEQMFDAAEAMHTQLASRPWILRVAIARAELRSECGDRDGALALIEEFAPEAESLGMIALAKQAAAIGAVI
jgi:tetratricopeptide (TPR) repeat protein